MIIAELYRYLSGYKNHWIQYSLFFGALTFIFIYGLLGNIGADNANSYERLYVFNLIYYLVLVRFFAAGFVNTYNEFHQGYYLKGIIYNDSIGKYNGLNIVLLRSIIRTIFSIVITFLGVTCMAIIMGVNYLYSNYIMLFITLIMGSVLLWGIALIFCSLCMFFEIQKEIALVGEVLLLCLFIFIPLEYSYLPTNFIKSRIYYILFKDIVLCEKGRFFNHDTILLIIVSIGIMIISFVCYRFLEWIKLRRGMILK